MRDLLRAVPFVVLCMAFALPAHAQVGFGSTVAVGDDEVFIGEPGNQRDPGIVYVYRSGPDGWSEAARLTRSNASDGDGFGASLVLLDDLLLVGATNVAADGAAEDGGGAVYLFRESADGWTEVGRVAADDLTEDDGFGGSVSVDGDLLLVGAAGQHDEQGAAYLFRRTADGWSRLKKLVGDQYELGAPEEDAVAEDAAAADDEEAKEREQPEDEAQADEDADLEGAVVPEQKLAKQAAEQAQDKQQDEGNGQDEPDAERFGSAVALHGDWLMVGAPGERRSESSGSVYVYRRGDEGWERFAKLPAESLGEGVSFGSEIVLRGDEALIAAPGADESTGAVHVYRLTEGDDGETEWSASIALVPFDGAPGARFGASILAADTEVLVGAPGAADGAGRIYRLARGPDGDWSGVSKVAGIADGDRPGFAGALAAGDDLLVAGQPDDDFGAGSAVILEREAEGWSRTRVMSAARGLDPVTGGAVECVDGKAGLFDCDNVDLYSFLPIREIGGSRGAQVNDMWGWTDPETGKRYALVGMVDRASFVDVTDPLNPIFVGTLPKTGGSPASIWRDIKVHADHAFIVSDSAEEHGVQVFDLTELRRFEGEPITFSENAHYDRVHSVHNIAVNTETAFAYVVGASGGGETCGGGLHMMNVEDPRQPFFEGCFADTDTGRRGTGYSHDAQCVVYRGPDERYQGHELCFGSNETALSIADVTDKENPVKVATATYPNVAYAHQGWLTEDHEYFYMNDEGDEAAGTVEGTRTLIWDVKELDDPILVGEYIHDVESMDHNLYIVGDTVYESNYNSGLRVLDITDREEPELAGYFDTVPWGDNEIGEGGMGSWSNFPFFDNGVVAVTSGREGLFLVKLDRAAAERPAPDSDTASEEEEREQR